MITKRSWVVSGASVVLALGLAGCDGTRAPVGARETVATLVISETWRSAVSAEEGAARIASLQDAISELREDTGTGWIGRQDDVTGYLSDLSGGTRVGSPEDFMDAYGPALFGVDATVLDLDDPDTETVPGMVSTRAAQMVGSVPVRDAVLLFNSHAGALPAADRLAGVRGRVFPGLRVGTDPQIPRRRAALIAAEASDGGRVRGRSHLMVLPNGEGQLTWEVTIVGGSAAGSVRSALYYVDAITGDLVDVRATSVQAHASAHSAGPAASEGVLAHSAIGTEPDPNDVQVSGVDPLGRPINARGRQTGAGVELVDSTTPAWQQGSGKGGIYTHDATGVEDGDMPGRLVVSPDTTIRDSEALAAHGYAREIIQYFEGLGRSSWDGAGGSLMTAVNYGPPGECNAYFDWGSAPMMIFANPCVEDGQQVVSSYVDIDVTAHEITHGVTASSAGLIYAGQSGALNESFSDYFGNVVGNLSKGEETIALSEDMCVGMPESFRCVRNPDGSVSGRYMLNGNGLDQYIPLLNLGTRMYEALGYNQDNGGVHLNSAIWNNALWSIRTQLAKIDNLPGNESPLAHSFDRVVYGALTTRLGPTSGFLDARAAVEQVIIDSGLDPVVLRVAREVFDLNNFCSDCLGSGAAAGSEVSAAVQGELHPSVSGDKVVWLDFGASNYLGQVASGDVNGSAPTLSSSSNVLEVVFGGESTVTLDAAGEVRRVDPSGTSTVLETVDPWTTVSRGLAGSDAGAAWAPSGDTLSFMDPAGTVTSVTLSGLGQDTITSVATGGGFVAAATAGGAVISWRPGEQPTRLGTMGATVFSLAAYGGNVLALSADWRARLFTSAGQTLDVSDAAMFFMGAAMSADYAVWAEANGTLASGVAPDSYNDTELFVLSLKTGKVYSPIPAGGQQGFPALSGNRLVWQDSGKGGDDIRTVELESGL